MRKEKKSSNLPKKNPEKSEKEDQSLTVMMLAI